MKDDWPKIAQITRDGKRVWRVDARFTNSDGKQVGERRTFDLKKDAEGWADQVRVTAKNEGSTSLHNAELASYGWSVSRAVEFALQHLRRRNTSVPVEQAVKELIETKSGAGRAARYCNDLRLRLGRLAPAFAGKTIGEITTGDLNAFLGNLKVAPATYNTFRRDIRTLWSFAEAREWATAATAKKTERAKSNGGTPAILTPAQAAALMVASGEDKELVAYHAISLFAGLRVSEVMKLEWGKHVDLMTGFIKLDPTITKTAQRRLVPISDNLRAWLQPIAQSSGKVIRWGLRKRHEAAREAAGIAWVENIMRHSFVSYRLAKVKSAPEVALESGHDVKVLFQHYRELVTPVDAERYFSIAPSEAASEKVLSLALFQRQARTAPH